MSRMPAPGPYPDRTILVPGTPVGEFTDVTFLGLGGTSNVYRAARNNVYCVLKEVSSRNPRALGSLMQEKALLERLQHPAIVRYYGCFEANGFTYLVREYIDGFPLTHLQTQPVEAQVREWGVQLCDILSYLHTQDNPLLYRDLQLKDVFLQNNRVRLVDFGLLQRGGQLDFQRMGNVSPEIYAGTDTDQRSDVYTLGACLYDLLAFGRGHRPGPFQFQPIREINDSVSLQMEAILQRCTQLRPEDRFQSLDELQQKLAAGRSEAYSGRATDPVIGPPDPPPGRTRSKLLWPVAGLLAFAIGLGGYLAYSYMNRSSRPAAVTPSAPDDPGLAGPVFYAKDNLVSLGGAIGLFETAESAQTLAERLNELYHARCLRCRAWFLSPRDVMIGNFEGQPVLFYAHVHGDEISDGPILLAKGSRKQMGHWRDLLKDAVLVSRGEEAGYSELDPGLKSTLIMGRQSARTALDVEEFLKKVPQQQLSVAADYFRRVDEKVNVPPDYFPPDKGFSPLPE